MKHGYDKAALTKRLHRIEGQVGGIEHRGPFDRPPLIPGEVAPLQFGRAGDGLWVVIERVHARAEATRGETEEAASRTDVEEALPVEALDAQGFLE